MARPSRRRHTKSFQTIILQTVAFVSLFAIAGHLSVNFWERFIIQNELVKMKTSLYSLKETINYIGTAYDNLEKEIVVLAELAEKYSHIPFMPQKEPPKPQSNKSTLDRRMYRDIDVYAAPTTANQTTQNFYHHNHNKFGKTDAATISEVYQDKSPVKEFRDMHIGIAPSISDKMVYVTDHRKVYVPKNATTMTRYPLKSIAVGSLNSESENKHNTQTKESCRHKHTHNSHCFNNEYTHSKYSSPYPFWKF